MKIKEKKMMKRWLTIGLSAVLCLTVAACGSSGPADTYESALKKYLKSDDVILTVTQNISMADGSTVMQSNLNGELRVENPDGKKTKASMEGVTSIDMGGGSAMDVALSYYYTDNTIYANMAGTQYCMDADWDQAVAQMGPAMTVITGPAESDFSTLEEAEQDGKTVLSFEITGEKVAKILGVTEQWTRFAEKEANGSISFDRAVGTLTIDKSKPVEEHLTITGSIINGEQIMSVTQDINILFQYEDAAVSLPNLESYQKIERK